MSAAIDDPIFNLFSHPQSQNLKNSSLGKSGVLSKYSSLSSFSIRRFSIIFVTSIKCSSNPSRSITSDPKFSRIILVTLDEYVL